MAPKAAEKSTVLEIPQIDSARMTFCVIGTRPLICNRLSEKAKRELFLPGGRTRGGKAGTLKHNPYEEFRASPYRFSDPEAPTLLAFACSAFKSAIMDCTVDLPGVAKAQIGRLVWVEGDLTPIYGTPRMFTSVVRNSDMAHTPDLRTRVIVPEWACRLEISFVRPALTAQTVLNLLAHAGVTIGVGDWRPEKGSGTYGKFEIVNENDVRFQEITRQGRAEQLRAMAEAEFYDADTEELVQWWKEEVKRRGVAAEGAE